MRPLPSTILLLAVATVTAQEAAKPEKQDPGKVTFADALFHAKKYKAPLLVFVVPDTDGPVDKARAAAQREAELAAGLLKPGMGPDDVNGVPPIATQTDLLLRQVQLLRASAMFDGRHLDPGMPLTDVQRIWTLAVPVVAKARTCGAKPGETIVLLGVDGKPLRGFAVDLQDHAAFAKSIGAELLAPETLAARRETADPELVRAFDRISELWKTQQAGTDEFQRLHEKLSGRVLEFAPAVIGSPREAQMDVFAQSLLLQHRVPFGAEEKVVITADPCPTCGMGYLPPQLNSVLKLLGP